MADSTAIQSETEGCFVRERTRVERNCGSAGGIQTVIGEVFRGDSYPFPKGCPLLNGVPLFVLLLAIKFLGNLD